MFFEPMDILKEYPIRKTKKQKQLFCNDVTTYAQLQGYPVRLERIRLGGTNIVIGDPQNAKYLITAHYDTPARLLWPNYLFPTNLAASLLFVSRPF